LSKAAEVPENGENTFQHAARRVHIERQVAGTENGQKVSGSPAVVAQAIKK
jgi:hypothetical protein